MHVLKMLTHRDSIPGAERLIRHLSKHKIPIAIATSSSLGSVQMKTFNHQEVFSLFDHMVMGSSDPEVVKGKPNPDIFLVCGKRFPGKPDPEQVSSIFWKIPKCEFFYRFIDVFMYFSVPGF